MKLTLKYVKKYWKNLLINLFAVTGFVLIEVGIPTLLAQGINSGFMGNDVKYIASLALKMLALAAGGLLLLIMLAKSTTYATTAITSDLRNDLFDKIQTFSRDEYEYFGVSRLITNTGNDCYVVMQFLTLIMRTGLIAPMMIVSSFFMIFRQSPNLAFVTLLVVPFLFAGIIAVNKKTKPISEKQQEGLDDINQTMRESLSGLRVIRAFNREEFQNENFEKVNSAYSKLTKMMFQKVAIISPIFTTVFCTAMMVLIKLGLDQINAGMLEFGSLAAFIEYLFHVLFSFFMLSTVLMMYPRFSVSVRRIGELFDTIPSVGANREKGVTETKTSGYLEFKNVDFAYADGADELVIEKMSFQAEPGQTVAFIGSTGSGKSTLIKLIPRFADVDRGQIIVDSVDVRDYNIDALRKKIGYIPQKATLFSGTIRENLKFGNENATDEDLGRACDIAQASEFISALKDGYDHLVAEGGTNLSGGQKQRLCIARALTRDASIYIFDDCFSALDFKTDSKLRAALKENIKNSTMLIVAQRIATIMDADKIIVLNEGKVIGEGTHKQLLNNNKIYKEIAESQLSEEELTV